MPGVDRRGAIVGTLVAAALAVSAVPVNAGAAAIRPHGATHVVTQLTAPAPAPSPASAPTSAPVVGTPSTPGPGPASSSPPVLNAGPGSRGESASRPEPTKRSGPGSPAAKPSVAATSACDSVCLSGQRDEAYAEMVRTRYASIAEPNNVLLEAQAKLALDRYHALNDAVQEAHQQEFAEAERLGRADDAARAARHKARDARAAAALAEEAREERKRLTDEIAIAMGYGDDTADSGDAGSAKTTPCLGDDPLYMRNWDVEDPGGANGDCWMQ